MNDIFSMNEDHRLDSLSSNSTSSAVASQRGLLQIGLEVAVTLISQVNKVIAPADAPGNPLMFAQTTIDAAFNLDGFAAVDVGFV